MTRLVTRAYDEAAATASDRSWATDAAIEAVDRYRASVERLNVVYDANRFKRGGTYESDAELRLAQNEWADAESALIAKFPTLCRDGCGLIRDGRLYVIDRTPGTANAELIVVDLARIADLSH